MVRRRCEPSSLRSTIVSSKTGWWVSSSRQTAFPCGFLGGPERYEGKPLPQAHARLPLLPGHFDRRHWLLEQVLVEHGVPEEVRLAWLRIDEALRPSVLLAAEDARDRTHKTDVDPTDGEGDPN